MTKLRFSLTKLSSRLWIRPMVYSLAAIAWVVIAVLVDTLIDHLWGVDIPRETLVNLFTILASTMLSVATFSVSAVASAFGAVGSSASPRATRIVMSDSGVQSTLAAFLATFIYAVVAITSLSALEFHPAGRFLLFIGFVVLVSWVLVAFVTWVDRVSRLGKMATTLDSVTAAARTTLSNPDISGTLGGLCSDDTPPPKGAQAIPFDRFGYVQHVDMTKLQALAEEWDAKIWLHIRPGSNVARRESIGRIATDPPLDEDGLAKIVRCIAIGSERSYDTDPRFVMIILAEIADRALSPAVNDPGTAISILAHQVELFHLWAETDLAASQRKPQFNRIFVPQIHAADLIEDAFGPTARDGAGMIEVCVRLQKALRSIMHTDHVKLRAAAAEYRGIANEMAQQRLPIENQKNKIDELAKRPI
jgi:uncharacterized membrane protein